MSQVLTAAQMREIEQTAIRSGLVTGLELMERAGQGVVAAMFKEWPALASGAHRAVVLCGPGNNGGDGFVVARLLAKAGWQVDLYATGWDMIWRDGSVRPSAPPDARVNAQRWYDTGGRITPLETDYGLSLCEGEHIVVVDALLGTGQNRDPELMLRHWWKAWDLRCNVSPGNHVHLVSVDVPTGYDTDSSALLTDAPFDPDLIVTFHTCKPVHRTLEKEATRIVVTDIGL